MARRVNEKLEQLRAWPGLGACTERELEEVAKLVDTVQLSSGRVLMREGELGREAFMILEGTADVTVDGEVIATVGPGSFVGEMALLENDVRTATVTATSPVTAMVMAVREFHAIVGRADVGSRLAADLSRKVRELEGAPSIHPAAQS